MNHSNKPTNDKNINPQNRRARRGGIIKSAESAANLLAKLGLNPSQPDKDTEKDNTPTPNLKK